MCDMHILKGSKGSISEVVEENITSLNFHVEFHQLNPSLGGKSVVWHHDGVEKYGKVILAQSHLENPRSGWQGSKSQNRSSVDAVADCPMYIYRYLDYK